MRTFNFDYPNTCPIIDDAIDLIEDDVLNFIDDLFYEACPLLPTSERMRLSRLYTKDLYSKISPAFEKVRATNEAMRDEAEKQISELCDTISNLEHELKHSMENAND